ncbi:MAG TPA: GerMN domain-containing protein [Mycobacteriales bacterium]|nr:GerMN domain-containing protein [Mycobacteriales bacterium]
MRTTRLLLAAGLLASSVAACSDTTPRSAGPAASSSAPSTDPFATPSLSDPGQTASPAPTGRASRAIYWVRDTGPRTGVRLYREFHSRPATTGVVKDAVEAMLTVSPLDDDYTSLWPEGTAVRAVRIDKATAYVDLTRDATSRRQGSAAERATLQQLVYTVTAAAPAVSAVQLMIEGKQVETLWGHSDTSRPMRREMAAAILGPVWILSPATVKRGGTVGGEASVFEATVSWEWVLAGKVVRKGFSNAAEGAPGRGKWSAPVDVPPGNYTFRAFESSAEDGRPIFIDDKPVRVTAA